MTPTNEELSDQLKKLQEMFEELAKKNDWPTSIPQRMPPAPHCPCPHCPSHHAPYGPPYTISC